METIAVIILLVLAAAFFVWLAPLLYKESTDENGGAEGQEEDEYFEPPAEVELPLEGALDLHTFSPKEVGRLVPDWLDLCHERGMGEVRIIHGKGKGVLRRQVHKILDRHPAVEGYELAGHGRGSWGATIVRLKPRAPKASR